MAGTTTPAIIKPSTTVFISCNTGAPTNGVSVGPTGSQVIVYNPDAANSVYLGWGTTKLAAEAAATIPVAAGAAGGYGIGPLLKESFSPQMTANETGGSLFVAGRTVSGTVVIEVTPALGA